MDFTEEANRLPWGKGVLLLACDPNGLIAVDKPSGVLSHPNKDSEREKSLLRLKYNAKEQCYLAPDDGADSIGEVYLLNRLDSATSGVVLLAFSQSVAAAALRAFKDRAVSKTYMALVFGIVDKGAAIWKDRIAVSHRQGMLRAKTGAGALAETKVLKAELVSGLHSVISRVVFAPVTGRTHQLRIQSSKRRLPIVGDKTYGDFRKNKSVAKNDGLKRLCLHCMETSLSYELNGRRWNFSAHSECPF